MQMEASVSVEEIIHTCSNERVAQAAVASIGFVFALRVKSAADVHGLDIGDFAARVVREFGRVADEYERKVVRGAMERSPQPILSGLKAILECKLEAESTLDHGSRPFSGWTRPAPEVDVRRAGWCV
jgi:hypothetical protein